MEITIKGGGRAKVAKKVLSIKEEDWQVGVDYAR